MKASEPTTAVSVLTPVGRSAVAVIEVAGPSAVAAVDACFVAVNDKRLADQPIDRIVFGHWRGDGQTPGEELVVCRTAATTVEVHCHGGFAAVAAVRASLEAHGCVAVDWRDQLSGQPTIDVEARIALADCVTDRTAAILLDQLNGALEGECQQIISAIERDDQTAASAAIDTLLARASIGRKLTQPWRVVLAGPVNVGKSSLINALVGYERAVVFDEPGVTRDVVTAAAAIAGWPVELSDTAGLRQASGELEAAGIERARQAIDQADVVLLVDAYEPASSQTACDGDASRLCELLGLDAGVADRSVLVANKYDIAASDRAPSAATLDVSATAGQGIAALVEAIGDRLVPHPPAAGVGVPFTARQVEWLRRASELISKREVAVAGQALQSLLAGEAS